MTHLVSGHQCINPMQECVLVHVPDIACCLLYANPCCINASSLGLVLLLLHSEHLGGIPSAFKRP